MFLPIVPLGPGHGMSPATYTALTLRQPDGILEDGGKNLSIASGKIVFGQEKVGITPVP